MQIRACTFQSQTIQKALISNVGISEAYNPESGKEHPKIAEFNAIWDTGATGSCITEMVINELALTPTGRCISSSAHGEREGNVYIVNILLPNNVGFAGLPVMEAKIKDYDVLLGMDVLSQGDFAVTGFDGRTTFSFRIPTVDCIDFVKYPIPRYSEQPGRNHKCPCGSGQKYKFCHGK